MSNVIVRASDMEPRFPDYPRVHQSGQELVVELEDGREYTLPDDPLKVLGLLQHFAGKVWADRRFFLHLIGRIAQARGWVIHPF